jgi:hypothetical protein
LSLRPLNPDSSIGFARVPLWFAAQRKSPASAFGDWRVFLFLAVNDEISNLDLIGEMLNIIKPEEIYSDIK